LNKQKVSGLSIVDIKKVIVDSFSIDIKGNANITVKGKVTAFDIKIDGTGDIDALRLSAKTSYISLLGSGFVKVNVQEYLNVNIDGMGTVLYDGDPTHLAHLDSKSEATPLAF